MSPTVGAYGKHPSAGDFLRLNANSTLVSALDDWLAEAFVFGRRHLADFEQSYDALGPSPFIFHQGGAGCLFGVLFSSHDKAGRRYPLLVFSELNQRWVDGLLTALPHERFLVDVVTVLERRHELDTASLLECIGEIAPPTATSLDEARQRYEHHRDQIGAAEFLNETLGGDIDQAHSVGPLRLLVEAARSNASYTVRCPLGELPTIHASLWLEAVSRGVHLPNAIWSRHALLVCPNRIAPRLFAGLLDRSFADEGLADMTSTRTEEPEDEPAENTQVHRVVEAL